MFQVNLNVSSWFRRLKYSRKLEYFRSFKIFRTVNVCFRTFKVVNERLKAFRSFEIVNECFWKLQRRDLRSGLPGLSDRPGEPWELRIGVRILPMVSLLKTVFLSLSTRLKQLVLLWVSNPICLTVCSLMEAAIHFVWIAVILVSRVAAV